jgi:SAM-dependent methyltransferase
MNWRQWLVHPLTAGLDPADPENFPFYEQIIRRKKFLRRLYREWYGLILTALPSGEEPVVELGSGAGFLRDFLPEAITTDIIPNPLVRMVLDGQALPFQKGSLRAVVMVNVLHHIPRPRFLLSEAGRCCRRGGALVLLEPWNTPWSRLVYNRWHHEPFDPEASDWELPPRRSLSAANQAMAWIIFHRDQLQLNREFPEWEIEAILPLMPFRYLFSGGLTWRALAPAWSFGLLRSLERGLHPWINSLAMFARIVLRRTGHIT